MQDEQQLGKLARYSGDPWGPGNEYFAKAEPHMEKLWEKLVWPFIGDCDFTSVVDLAAGHGRNSERLLPLVGETLYITDIQPGNVEVCAERFKGSPKVRLYAGNGYDFRPLADASVTLIYCFDAMVHFDSDVVRSYLKDSLRVLKPGGRAFYHHSNYTGGHDWRTNPGARNFMSAALFAHYALKEGLSVVRQKVIDWQHKDHDCVSLVEKPAAKG